MKEDLKPTESVRERFRSKLIEFADDATIGSTKLIAINDWAHFLDAESRLLALKELLSHQPTTERRQINPQMSMEEFEARQISREINHRSVALLGYDAELQKLSSITLDYRKTLKERTQRSYSQASSFVTKDLFNIRDIIVERDSSSPKAPR